MNATPRSACGWALSFIIPCLLLNALPASFSAQGILLLALMAGAAIQWSFRLVPDFVTGLMLLMLCVVLDIAPAAQAFSGFTSSVFFLVLGVFLLSALLTESALITRLTQHLLHLGRKRPAGSLLALLCTAIALTLALPSPLGRSAILAPLMRPLAEGRSKGFRTALLFVMAQGTTLWSTVFLTGNPLNFVLLGFLDTQSQLRFQWMYWLLASCCFAVLASIGFALLLAWLLRGEHDNAPTAAIAELTPPVLSWRDGFVILLYALLFVAIFTRHLHHIELHWIVLALAMIGLYVLPMPLQTIRTRVDWPTLLFIASIVSWQAMLHTVHVDAWINAHLPALLPYVHQYAAVNMLYLAALIFVIRLVVPGAPAFVILLTTLLPLASALGLSGWVLGFVMLTLSEGFVLSHQHGVLSHLLSEAHAANMEISSKQLLVANTLAWLLRLLALIASIPLWIMLSLI